MREDPYSAPQTGGDELRDTPRRPTSIKLAAAFIVYNFLAGHSKFLFVDTPTSGIMTGIAFALVVVITALLIAGVLSRVNLARQVVAVLLVANLSFFPFSLAHTPISELRIILVTQAIFQLGALVLIFLPPSLRWYRSNHSFKPNSLRESA